MRLHRVLITTLTAATIAVAGTALPAEAGVAPEVDLDVSCDGAGYISVEVINPDGLYDFYFNEIIVNEDTTDSSNGTYEDGLVLVEIFPAGETVTPFWTMNVPVACDLPYLDTIAVCVEGEGRLRMLIAYAYETEIAIYVDDMDTPVEGWEAAEDTNFLYLDLGAYSEGEHVVGADWAESESDGFVYQEVLTIDCIEDDSGSGAGIPPTGGSTSLALIAGLFVAAGAALLITRRLRTA